MPRINSSSELEEIRKEIQAKRDPNKPCIALCAGTGCLALGARKVIESFKEEVKRQGLEGKVDIRENGCPGFCERGTVVLIYPEGICYLGVKSEDAAEVVLSIQEKKVIERLLYVNASTGEKATYEQEIPFYGNQRRHLIGNNTRIDPRNIDDYLALGGYGALAKALF